MHDLTFHFDEEVLRCAPCAASAPRGDSLFAAEHGFPWIDARLEYFQPQLGAVLTARWMPLTFQGDTWTVLRNVVERSLADLAGVIRALQSANDPARLRQFALDDVALVAGWCWRLNDGRAGDPIRTVWGDLPECRRLVAVAESVVGGAP